MAINTKIEWTDVTWNPVTGCTKVSQGCKHCYAERVWKRLSKIPNTVYYDREFTDVQLHRDRLNDPMKWKAPRRVFVNSMSDLFHESVPFDFIKVVFGVMAICKRHQFQILTKRPERALAFFQWIGDTGEYFDNIFLGVSVEDNETALQRIPEILKIESIRPWVSIEPLLDVVFLLSDWMKIGIQWVVVGGESGPGARPMHPDHVRRIQRACEEMNIPFFFKQWGELLPHCQSEEHQQYHPVQFPSPNNSSKMNTYYRIGKKQAGALLDGNKYEEMP